MSATGIPSVSNTGLSNEPVQPKAFCARSLNSAFSHLLQVGAIVETRLPDGSFQEAIVSKLTDASWYTVGE